MTLSPLQRPVEAAALPPERLAGHPRLTEQEKVAEASRHFEAMLLRQILQQTQKPVIPSKYADNSFSAGVYRDMITHQLAESISRSGDLGLARTFAQQLSPAAPPVAAAASGGASPASPASPARATARPELPPPAGRAAELHASIRSRRAPALPLNSHE